MISNAMKRQEAICICIIIGVLITYGFAFRHFNLVYEHQRQQKCPFCHPYKENIMTALTYITISDAMPKSINLPPLSPPRPETGTYGYATLSGFTGYSSGTFMAIPDDKKAIVSISLKSTASNKGFNLEYYCSFHADKVTACKTQIGMLLYNRNDDSFTALDKISFPYDLGGYIIDGSWTDSKFYGVIKQK